VNGLLIDVSTITTSDNHNQKNSIVNGVQNSIMSYSESLTVTSSEWP